MFLKYLTFFFLSDDTLKCHCFTGRTTFPTPPAKFPLSIRRCQNAASSRAPALRAEDPGPEEIAGSDAHGGVEDGPLMDAIRSLSISPSGDAARLFHGRGGAYGDFCKRLTLDFFPPAFLLTDHGADGVAGEEPYLAKVEKELQLAWERNGGGGEVTFVYQSRRVPHGTGGASHHFTRTVAGSLPEPHVVAEDGSDYYVRLAAGQNHGLFLDMRDGRRWLRNASANARVLNLFAYTCAFSVVALGGGAARVVNLDMSRGALDLGRRNHALNGLDDGRARFLSHDLFKTWGKLRKAGPYDVIVCDPPSYQKGSFVARKDYGKVVRRLTGLLDPKKGGRVMLCLNAPELDAKFLRGLVEKEAPELEFVERLANPDSFPAADDDRALKVFIYQYRPTNNL